MGRGETKWLAFADDELLDTYASSTHNKKFRAKYENAADALSALDNVAHFGFQTARLEEERRDRDWRKNLDGVPEAKIKKIDQEKLARISKELKEQEKGIRESFARAKKLRGKLN